MKKLNRSSITCHILLIFFLMTGCLELPPKALDDLSRSSGKALDLSANGALLPAGLSDAFPLNSDAGPGIDASRSRNELNPSCGQQEGLIAQVPRRELFPVEVEMLRDLRAIGELRIRPKPGFLNPYRNKSELLKGQVHCHSKRGREDGVDMSARDVLETYGGKGYDFVSLTDHDRRNGGISNLWMDEDLPCSSIFNDPGVSGIIYIPGEEGGKGHRQHLLEIGLTQQNPCRPSGDFRLDTRVLWVENRGGMAAAPHPLANGHVYSDDELFDTLWLRGIEINDSDNIPLWDRLLRGDRVRWGVATDDAHGPDSYNKRWVVINSDQDSPSTSEIVGSLREGNFFSVVAGSGYDGIYPQFIAINSRSYGIHVKFSHAKSIRFLGKRGLLKEHDGFEENSDEIFLESLECDGSEGYVRIELRDSKGTVTYSQPIFVFGASREDCVPIDYEGAQIYFSGMQFKIGVNGASYLSFGWKLDEAKKALEIIKNYKFDKMCFVGRPNPSMTYFTTEGKAPEGYYSGEDCIPFNRGSLEISLDYFQYADPPYNFWVIKEGNSYILDFDDSEAEAFRAMEYINRYGFSKYCFVGRPNASMEYFRK